jgi:hypothetical protein
MQIVVHFIEQHHIARRKWYFIREILKRQVRLLKHVKRHAHLGNAFLNGLSVVRVFGPEFDLI